MNDGLRGARRDSLVTLRDVPGERCGFTRRERTMRCRYPSSRGVSTCVETARLPVFGGGAAGTRRRKKAAVVAKSVARNLRRATLQEPIFQNFPKKKRRGGETRAIRWHLSPTRRVCQVGAVRRGRRDEPKQARERRAGGDHRQRHLRPVLPARRLRSVPRRSQDHGRGRGARQASAAVHGRLPGGRERVDRAGPRPAVRRDERQGHRADRYVRTNPTNEPEPLATNAAQRSPRRSRAACVAQRSGFDIHHSSHARSRNYVSSADRTPATDFSKQARSTRRRRGANAPSRPSCAPRATPRQMPGRRHPPKRRRR